MGLLLWSVCLIEVISLSPISTHALAYKNQQSHNKQSCPVLIIYFHLTGFIRWMTCCKTVPRFIGKVLVCD